MVIGIWRQLFKKNCIFSCLIPPTYWVVQERVVIFILIKSVTTIMINKHEMLFKVTCNSKYCLMEEQFRKKTKQCLLVLNDGKSHIAGGWKLMKDKCWIDVCKAFFIPAVLVFFFLKSDTHGCHKQTANFHGIFLILSPFITQDFNFSAGNARYNQEAKKCRRELCCSHNSKPTAFNSKSLLSCVITDLSA